MPILGTLRQRISAANSEAAQSRSRSALNYSISFLLVSLVNGVIGFFVQWLIFANTTPTQAWSLLQGDGTGADFIKFVFICIVWELWLIVGVLQYVFVTLFETNIVPKLPWNEFPLDLQSPIVVE